MMSAVLPAMLRYTAVRVSHAPLSPCSAYLLLCRHCQLPLVMPQHLGQHQAGSCTSLSSSTLRPTLGTSRCGMPPPRGARPACYVVGWAISHPGGQSGLPTSPIQPTGPHPVLKGAATFLAAKGTACGTTRPASSTSWWPATTSTVTTAASGTGTQSATPSLPACSSGWQSGVISAGPLLPPRCAREPPPRRSPPPCGCALQHQPCCCTNLLLCCCRAPPHCFAPSMRGCHSSPAG